MSRLLQRGIAEEGMDRSEPRVASANRIAPAYLEIVEKVGDERGIEILETELRRTLRRRRWAKSNSRRKVSR